VCSQHGGDPVGTGRRGSVGQSRLGRHVKDSIEKVVPHVDAALDVLVQGEQNR
jgi:hypothetical protein